jgi:hypothetical protein
VPIGIIDLKRHDLAVRILWSEQSMLAGRQIAKAKRAILSGLVAGFDFSMQPGEGGFLNGHE